MLTVSSQVPLTRSVSPGLAALKACVIVFPALRSTVRVAANAGTARATISTTNIPVYHFHTYSLLSLPYETIPADQVPYPGFREPSCSLTPVYEVFIGSWRENLSPEKKLGQQIELEFGRVIQLSCLGRKQCRFPWERRAPARLRKPRWSVALPGTTRRKPKTKWPCTTSGYIAIHESHPPLSLSL